MYTRVLNPSIKSRSSKKFTNFAMFLTFCLLLFLFCFSLTFYTVKLEDRLTSPATYSRQAELPTWTLNQSVSLSDYMSLSDSSSFSLTPSYDSFFIQNEIVSDNDTFYSMPIPNFCGHLNSTQLLILVASAPSHFEQRNAIRKTWGSKNELDKHRTKMYFVMGRTNNETIEESVERESESWNDVIKDDFMDSYHNLTLKSLSMLKWVNVSCGLHSPPHVLKVDDDIFINLPRIFTVINDLPGALMIGRLICGAEPVSKVGDKLFMPSYLYSGRMYPGYLSGTAYLLSGSIIPKLLSAALRTPLIHIEDIYITGILAKKSFIYPEDSPYFTYAKIEPKDICILKQMVSSHQISPKEMFRIWTSWNDSSVVDCASVLTPQKKRKLFRKSVPRFKNMGKRLKKLCMFPT